MVIVVVVVVVVVDIPCLSVLAMQNSAALRTLLMHTSPLSGQTALSQAEHLTKIALILWKKAKKLHIIDGLLEAI